MSVDRGTPGIEAAAKVRFGGPEENYLLPSAAERIVSAFLAAEPPADVLRALFSRPERTRRSGCLD